MLARNNANTDGNTSTIKKLTKTSKTIKLDGTIYLSIYVSIIYLSVCLSVYRYVCACIPSIIHLIIIFSLKFLMEKDVKYIIGIPVTN